MSSQWDSRNSQSVATRVTIPSFLRVAVTRPPPPLEPRNSIKLPPMRRRGIQREATGNRINVALYRSRGTFEDEPDRSDATIMGGKQGRIARKRTKYNVNGGRGRKGAAPSKPSVTLRSRCVVFVNRDRRVRYRHIIRTASGIELRDNYIFFPRAIRNLYVDQKSTDRTRELESL